MEHNSDLMNFNFTVFWKVLKKEKWILILITSFFAVIGTFYAYSISDEFISVGKILPEASTKANSAGQFAGLAALAGVDLGTGSGAGDAVRPDLYPEVLRSTTFFLKLFNEKVKDRTGNEVVFKSFYEKKILKGRLKPENQTIKFPKSEKYLIIDKQSEFNIKDLKKRIVCIYDKKTGVILISVKMPDPVVSAIITRFCINYLTEYIINYRTEKQRKDLLFLEERLANAKGKYFKDQSKKANYSDQMPLSSLRLQSADLKRERIESDYRISSTFYNSLLQKYEEAKLKIEQETPVIKVFEPPVVPNFRSEPNRIILIVGSVILGLIFSMTVSFLKDKQYKLLIY